MSFKAGLLALSAIASLAACSSAPGQQAGGPTAKLDAGVVQGEPSGDLNVFLGIPYAAPPSGNLRWRAPQPVTAWSGVKQATAIGAACRSRM